MSENKRQHYVPKNYLREFSDDGLSIGVYLVGTGKSIEAASISSQAQESFFYGKNLELEKQLSEVEAIMADNRKTIFAHTTNKLTVRQREILYQDMMLQLSRTKYMANLYEEVATAQVRRIWKHSGDEMIRKYVDDVGIKFENPILESMSIILNNLDVCLNLEYKVLVNKTEIPFMTSDNPVCQYNQFFEAQRRYHSGLGNTGEQIYYPLSPSYAVLYYDHNVYTAKFRKRDYLEIADVSDVNHLNGLVCAWANKCVYYHPGKTTSKHVHWTYRHVRDSRPKKIEETEVPTGHNSSLIVARYPFPAFGMNVTFLKFQDKVKPYNIKIC